MAAQSQRLREACGKRRRGVLRAMRTPVIAPRENTDLLFRHR
jgi:hypothetical protein